LLLRVNLAPLRCFEVPPPTLKVPLVSHIALLLAAFSLSDTAYSNIQPKNCWIKRKVALNAFNVKILVNEKDNIVTKPTKGIKIYK